jgi:hypothetical protein
VTPPRDATPSEHASYHSYSSHRSSLSSVTSHHSAAPRAGRAQSPAGSMTDDEPYSETDEPIAKSNQQMWTAEPKGAADPNPVKEISALRTKNADLQRAVDAVREQLARIAPKLTSNVKRKHSVENDRMNRLQQEAQQLQAEHAGLSKKMRDVEHVKELEKQMGQREAEVKSLAERNKYLQVEVRNNAKKLKQMATIEDQRSQQLTGMKHERKVAQNALAKAQRDAELALQGKDGALKRLRVLESKDRLPELKAEDVKQLIEMKTSLATKQETIESLQYRLSVLKRAHESVNRAIVSNPQETAEIEDLKAEVLALKSRLAQASTHDEPTAAKKAPAKKPGQGRTSDQRKREEKAAADKKRRDERAERDAEEDRRRDTEDEAARRQHEADERDRKQLQSEAADERRRAQRTSDYKAGRDPDAEQFEEDRRRKQEDDERAAAEADAVRRRTDAEQAERDEERRRDDSARAHRDKQDAAAREEQDRRDDDDRRRRDTERDEQQRRDDADRAEQQRRDDDLRRREEDDEADARQRELAELDRRKAEDRSERIELEDDEQSRRRRVRDEVDVALSVIEARESEDRAAVRKAPVAGRRRGSVQSTPSPSPTPQAEVAKPPTPPPQKAATPPPEEDDDEEPEWLK